MLAQVQNGISNMFDKKITLGNIIEIGVLLVAITLAYGKFQATQDVMWVQITDSKDAIQVLKKEAVKQDVHNLQIQMINEKLADIQADLKEIKKEVKK